MGTGFDIAVIGAGIAGASVAAELARDARVLLLEREDAPGRHSTGRSAAIFSPCYGPAPIRALTRASEAFLRDPPDGFARTLLTARDILAIAREDQLADLDAALAALPPDPRLTRIDGAEAHRRMPLLRAGYTAAALLDTTGGDLDAAALHQGYLRALTARGGRLQTRAGVTGLTRAGGLWRIGTAAGAFEAPLVVNAAGAWADALGALAGAEPIGLVPKRRTMLILPVPEGVDAGALPLTDDVGGHFYMKPEPGRLLVSPANEDPVPPCDVQPEEMDIALCMDRIGQAFDLPGARILHRWAGLRSFVADGAPVVGASRRAEGFFWLAGQGGYGIQSAPALSRLAAALVRGAPVPPDIAAEGLDLAAMAPGRGHARA
jgi:D-arginine dehydrogenase